MSALLPLATISYAIGIMLADRAVLGVAASLALGSGAFVLAFWFRRDPNLRALAVVVAIGSCGALTLASQRDRAVFAAPDRPRDARVEGTVCASREYGSSISVDLCDCSSASGNTLPVPHRLRVFESVDPEVRAVLRRLRLGQRIRAQLRIRPIQPAANPGSRDRRDAYARRGIGAHASLRAGALLVRLSSRDRPGSNFLVPLREAIARRRRSIGERLTAGDPGGGLARALVLGDRSALPEEAREAFARIGIGHLLAVSGLHVALVAGFAFALVRRSCLGLPRLSARLDPRRVALCGAFVCALIYGGISGWGIPVRRALLFLTVACGAVASRRSVRSGQVLCLAALPLLILEPHALFDMGAQLSFVASAGLLLARRQLGAGPRGLAALARTSATAIAATAPWVAWHGGAVGVFGVVANLVAVPWVGLVVLPASLLAACMAALPESALTRLLISGVAQLGEWTLACVISAAAWLPTTAGSGVSSMPVLLLAGAISVLALWIRSTRARVMWCLVESALLSFSPAQAISPAAPRVISFDVGQGDATLIQGRSGAVLIDAGRAIDDAFDMGQRVVVPGLAALDLAVLDLVIATHADIDHRGGLEAVLERVPTRELWLPRGTLELADFRGLLEIAERRDVRVRERGAHDPAADFGDLRVVPLWPPSDRDTISRNDASLVVRVELREAGQSGESILLTGDLGMRAERQLIKTGVSLRSTVLKVGHHGSRGSSSREFLSAVQATIVLVSAPCHGRSGLPSAPAMDRLAESGAEVWWTGQSGAVIVGFGTRDRPRVVGGWHSNVQCRVH